MLWHLYIVLGCLANMIWFVWPPLLTDVLPGCLWPNLINLGRQAPQPQQKCCIHFCKWQVFEPHFWDENIYVYPIYIYEHPYIYTSMCTIIKTYMLGRCPICKSTRWVQPISFTAHAEKQCASRFYNQRFSFTVRWWGLTTTRSLWMTALADCSLWCDQAHAHIRWSEYAQTKMFQP